MTDKGIARLRKIYNNVSNMDPRQLQEFDTELLHYIGIQRLAKSRTSKERAIQEISPALSDAEKMHAVVSLKLRALR